MSERKKTPDVLADILGTGANSPAPMPIQGRSSRSAAPRRSTPTQSASKTQRWKYMVVSCQDYRGWRPRYEDGVELTGWTRGPLLPSYLEDRGREGWELVAASSGRAMFGVADCFQLFFKKPSD